MSFADRLLLWAHIAFVIFAIGPVTAAMLTTPRYIRKRNLVVVRYLHRTTLFYGLVSLGVLVAGAILAQLLHDFTKPWLTVSMTLFIVALVLQLLIMRDQRRAINALEDAAAEVPDLTQAEVLADAQALQPAGVAPGGQSAAAIPVADTAAGSRELHLAVERGRIASLGGIVTLIWLVILVLMVWR